MTHTLHRRADSIKVDGEDFAMLSMAAKKFNEKEMLSKTYLDFNEIKQRYIKRELQLFRKVIRLRKEAKKLFIFGSPVGTYQIYY